MPASRLQRRLLNGAACLVTAGVIAALAGDAVYRSWLFQRGSFSLDQIRRGADIRSVCFWPGEGAGYRGFVSPATTPAPKGTIVIFHGNAGLALHRTHYIPALEPLGYRVVLAEYPGYGMRQGGLSEETLIRDGAETAEAARQAFGEPLYIWGESMGCAVAAGVAARLKTRVHGLVLITPWDNLPELTESLFPRYPVRRFVPERFDTAAGLETYGGPTAFLVADRDELVPVAQTKRLVLGYKGPKKLWHFSNASHTTWPTSPSLSWWQDVMQFHEQLDRAALAQTSERPPKRD